MLSDEERELGRIRYGYEKNMFVLLDKYFEDPSDENLALLQDVRHDHKQSVKAMDSARQRRRDREKAEATKKAADAAVMYVKASTGIAPPSISTTAEMEKRLDELTAKAESLRGTREEAREKAEKVRAAAAKKSWWEKLLGE